MTAVVSLLAPLLAGAALILLALGRPWGRLEVAAAVAAGYPIGVGLLTGLLWLSGAAAVPTALTLFGLTAALAAAAWWSGPAGSRPCPPVTLPSPWPRAVWWLLLGLLVVQGGLQLGEALGRPVYPWDAWSAWLVKGRVWAELGRPVDFVSFDHWLAASGEVYTNEAWQYPEMLPLLQYWISIWLGSWNESWVKLPWPLAWAALAGLAYVGLRRLHADSVPAMVAAFLVGTMPILAVQAALPGYADAWIALEILAFSVLASWWLAERRPWLLVPATVLLLMLAATKLEGVLWALICVAVLGAAAAGRRRTLVAAALLTALLVGWWSIGGVEGMVGGQRLAVTPAVIELPYLGRYPLSFSNQLGSFVIAFLQLPNWHLVWYLMLPALVVVAWRRQGGPWVLPSLVYAGLGVGFLFVLFFMTEADVWAESMTASNRLALQFVPAMMYWLSLGVSHYLRSDRTA